MYLKMQKRSFSNVLYDAKRKYFSLNHKKSHTKKFSTNQTQILKFQSKLNHESNHKFSYQNPKVKILNNSNSILKFINKQT